VLVPAGLRPLAPVNLGVMLFAATSNLIEQRVP
jgi:hypothetical protein